MKQGEELIRALQETINVPEQVVLGEVTAIDTTKQTATIMLDTEGNVTYDVRLKAVINSNDKGLITYPVTGTNVLAGKIYNNDDYVLLACDEVEKYLIDTGDDGGLVNVTNLADRLSNIENDLKALHNIFLNWVPAPMDGGAALKTMWSSYWSAKNSSVGTRSDVELKGK